jgi:hypothetical protein
MSAGILTGHRMEGRAQDGRLGLDSQRWQEMFHSIETGSVANPTSYSMNSGVFFPLDQVKRPKHEAYHSPLYSTDVKNGGTIN